MLLTKTDLIQRSDAELAALYRTISEAYWDAPPNSHAAYTAMISLENIRREQSRRRPSNQPRTKGPRL